MSSADIVKSAYMIDPSDGCSLVKREAEAGTEIDREYWQRVNQARTKNTNGKIIQIKIVPEFEALTHLVLGTIGFKHAEKLSETFVALG